MLISVFLIISVIFDLHLTHASDCIHLWPYDPEAVDGKSFDMWCSVLPNCSLTSSDIFFTFDEGVGGDEVDQGLVTVLNSTVIRLTYPRISVSLNQKYLYCMQRISNNGSSVNAADFDVQLLSVGFQPSMPSIRKDYKVFNWEYFEFHCTIKHTGHVYNTKYEAWFRRTIDSDFIKCGEERKRSRWIEERTCRILDALGFVHPNGILFFKINGSNAVGSVSTDVERANLYHLIQPGPVKNMTIVSSVETGVNVTFYAPKKEKRLKYNISVNCESTSWVVRTSNHGSPTGVKLNLPLPPFTNCSLSISCLPYYNRQYWSEPSEAVFFTSPDAVPLMSPDICCISIEPSSSEFRNVTVYFQKLTDGEARGKVTKYHYNLTSSRSDRRLPYSKEKQLPANATSLLLEWYRDTESVVRLNAETRAGLNHSIASRLSIPSEENVLPHPKNATVIWLGSETMRISWSKEDNEFNSIVVWCQSSTTPCKSPVNWKKTKSTFHDIKLAQKDLHSFGIAKASSDGSRISAIDWIKCIYDISRAASVPRVSVVNKTSSSICLDVKPADCTNKDQGYTYEYRIQYRNGEKTSNVTKSVSDCNADGECQFQFSNLSPESNYTFTVVPVTAVGPSKGFVLSELTDSTGALQKHHLIWIICGSFVVLVLISIGIYTCVNWNKQLVMKLRRWLRIKVTFPDTQTVVERGIADGNNVSSSYTSLSKKDTSVHLQPQHFDSNHSDVKLEEQSVSETAFIVKPNDKNSTETENSSNNKSSNAAKKGKPVRSSSHPSSFQKGGSRSNPGSSGSGSPPKSSSADHVIQSTSAGSRVEFIDGSGTGQRNPDGNTNRYPPSQSTSRDTEILGDNQENVASVTQSTASAEQSDALHRSNETDDDPLDRNNFSADDNEHELEIDDYSNVRVSSDGFDETQTTPDSYSLARLPSGDDVEDDDSNGRDYSTALLMDDNNLGVSDEPPGCLDDNFSSEEDDRHNDANYSTASMIRKSK